MRSRFLSALPLLVIAWLAAGAAFAEGRWPSLNEQLARDRVPAGSALAKLIAENQEFQLLRPAEARDKLGIPPWLRVLWRKQHPELDYSGGDPTGGYPLALRDVHEWMVSHPDLKPGRPEPDSPLEAEAKASSADSDLAMGGPQTGFRSESDIRVNYWDPSQIVASSNNLGATGRMAMYYSHDGGQTWKLSNLALSEGDSFQSDPTVEWTSDGTAWTVAIGVVTPPLRLTLRTWRSSDGGATWEEEEDGIVSGAQTIADRQVLWTDHSDRSPFKDRMYAIWHNGRPVFMNKRSGPDGSWGEPVQVSGAETFGTGIGPDVKTNAAGHVFGFWPDTGSRRIFVVRSTDGGKTFSKPTVVANTYGAFNFGIPAQNSRGAALYVTAGAFLSGRKSMVYAAWTDVTGAPGCRTPFDDPFTNVDSPCKTRIWFSRSTTGGLRWSKPLMINNAPTKNDQFHASMVVDQATGAIGIIYYDTAGEERTKVNVWYQSSFDGGVRWSAPLRISSAPSDNTNATATGFQFGDYNGFSGIAGTFFPSWSDHRGFRDEIWTAKITDTKSLTCKTTDLFADGVGTGAASVAVPSGATETRLAFWHRRQFASGRNGGSLKVSVDGGPALSVPASAILSGAGYGEADEALFKGRDRHPVSTVVDLDAVCSAATGAGCAGRSLRLLFSAGDLPAEKADRWLLDEVAVTACTP
ncbi:MAG TPA: sialidase family protein [Thermoanaerobaculia bacterium]|jgi:hypothetical protein